jgi:hypothetical protein
MICYRDPVNTAGHILAHAHYICVALQAQGAAENIHWQNLLNIKYWNA